jgi:two-component system phosphate regulon response regulator PhoB
MKKVIIVEDDAVAGFVYRTNLTKEGYDVEVAADGEAGLARIEATCPDAVLLDLMLPKMSGVEVLKKMRAQPYLSKIPVMVFTNAFVPAMINDAMQAGATKVFNKSEVTPNILVEALKSAGCSAKEG